MTARLLARTVWVAFAICVLFLASGPGAVWAQAGTFPTRPITLLCAYPPGGGVDQLARIVANVLPKYIGAPVVVVNRDGAGGTIGTAEAARATPDGYTLLLALAPPVVFSPHVLPVPYTAEDFQALAILTMAPNALLAGPAAPGKTWDEIVAYARAHPRKLIVAHSGVGDPIHAQLLAVFRRLGAEVTFFPAGGGGPALQATLAGDAHLIQRGIWPAKPYVDSGDLIPLLVGTAESIPEFPGLLGMKDIGMEDLAWSSWRGILAPKGLPADVAAVLDDAIRRMTEDPEYIELVDRLGEPQVNMFGDVAQEYMLNDYRALKKMVEEVGYSI